MTFVVQRFLWLTYISITLLYTILLSRDLKNQKVGHHPPPTIHHPLNKTKISALKIQILIKYKRIKWTPRVMASLLSSQGDKCVKKLAMNLLYEIRNNRYRKSKQSVLFTLSELTFFSNKNGFVENVYNNSKPNKQDLCVDNVVKTESKIIKHIKKDSKINRKNN